MKIYPNSYSRALISLSVVLNGVFCQTMQMLYITFMVICIYNVIGESIEKSCDQGCAVNSLFL